MTHRSRLPHLSVLAGSAALALVAGMSASLAAPPDSKLDEPFRGNVRFELENAHAHSHKPGPGFPENGGGDQSRNTRTPIKHVILIIGENRTFDHVFATYQPPKGESVWNLLSRAIVNLDGSPGPHVALAQQWQAQTNGTFRS